MIDLYTWTTPNGRKISIMLEECGLPYNVIPVDLGKEEQMKPEFLAINPNHKIPAIIDRDAKGGPKKLFESGAILVYLAEKSGKFLPADEPDRSEVIQWLMYQMSHVGPIIGQAGHFINDAPEKIPYAIQRFVNESARGSSGPRQLSWIGGKAPLSRRHGDLSGASGGSPFVDDARSHGTLTKRGLTDGGAPGGRGMAVPKVQDARGATRARIMVPVPATSGSLGAGDRAIGRS
jgi:hypothetical protein